MWIHFDVLNESVKLPNFFSSKSSIKAVRLRVRLETIQMKENNNNKEAAFKHSGALR